jgi:hypothetical protein
MGISRTFVLLFRQDDLNEIIMTIINNNAMADLQGGTLWGGFACAGAVIGAGLLYSNPATGTLAAMGSGFVVGTLIGACGGLIATGKYSDRINATF